MLDIKKFGDFIKNTIVGCSFVGFSSDQELFVQFEHEDDALKLNATELLMVEFPEIKKITIVERVNLTQAKMMLDDLNKALGEVSAPVKHKHM